MQQVTISIKSESHMDFPVAYLQLTLTHSKNKNQGYAHLYCKHIGNGKKREILLLLSNRKSCTIFHWAHLHLTYAHSKG